MRISSNFGMSAVKLDVRRDMASVNGVCVTSVGTNATECISTYIKNKNRKLNLKVILILRKSKNKLESVLPAVTDEALIV